MAEKQTIENVESLKQNPNETLLTALLELSQIAYRMEEKEIIHQALAYAVQSTGSEISYLNFVNKDHKTIKLIKWTESDPNQFLGETNEHFGVDQEEIWVDCVRIGKPVVHNDYQKLLNKQGYSGSHLDLTRHISVPIYGKDKLKIILGVENKATDYNSTDVLYLCLIGDQLVRILHGRQMEKAYLKTKHQYDQLVNHIPIGIFRVRTSGDDSVIFEYVNQQFCEMVNLSETEVYQDAKSVLNSIYPDEMGSLNDLFLEVMQNSKPLLWEGKSVVDGKTRWLQVEARPEEVQKGALIWHGVLTDTTGRKQVESAFRDANTLLENRLVDIEQLQGQLREQAIRDYLTGLFNRRYLDETIERELARAKRESSQLSVVMMDIDHFKSINDTYGHQAGDMVLIDLGTLLNKYSRSSDIACRHGGDEFVVVMPNASSEDARKRADEWRNVFAQQRFSVNERRFATTLSMGIASYPTHASSPKGLFQAADQALYQSKIHNNKVSISRRLATKTLRSLGSSES